MSDEGSLFAVNRVNSDLHVSAEQVNRGKEFLPAQINKNIINAGKGVRVLHSVCIESAIIYAEPIGVFRGINLLFVYYNYGGAIRTVAKVRFGDDSGSRVRVKLIVYKGSTRPG